MVEENQVTSFYCHWCPCPEFYISADGHEVFALYFKAEYIFTAVP